MCEEVCFGWGGVLVEVHAGGLVSAWNPLSLWQVSTAVLSITAKAKKKEKEKKEKEEEKMEVVNIQLLNTP